MSLLRENARRIFFPEIGVDGFLRKGSPQSGAPYENEIQHAIEMK